MSPEDKLKGKPRKGRLWFNTTCKHQRFVHTSETHTAVSTMSSVPETHPPPFVPVLCFNPAHNTDKRTERGVPCRHLFWFLDIYFHTCPSSWGQRPGCEAALLFYCRFSNYILSLQGCVSSLQLQRWTYWASQTETLDNCYCWAESITMQKRYINTVHLLTALLHCMRKKWIWERWSIEMSAANSSP